MNKTIRLKTLTLRDFQGGNFSLEAGDGDVSIFAANGVGKTRLFSSFTFLLFGKDSLNRSDFSIKNLNAVGDVADHGLQHTVEGVLEIDGEEVTLKKIYSEKYVKVRGGLTAEFSGHSTQHFVNSVPVQEKEYKAYIQELTGDEQTFRLLSSPTAFPQLPWQRQRQILMDLFGDVSDADIIASESKLAELPGILGKHKADDYKKIIAVRQAELTKALGTNKHPGTIETRIDEVRRSLPDVSALNRSEIEKNIARLETELNDAKLRLQGLDTGGVLAGLTKQLAVINSECQKLESAHYSETMKTVNRLNQEIAEIEAMTRKNNARLAEIESSINTKRTALAGLPAVIESYRQKWTQEDATVFTFPEFVDTTAENCGACGQPLPADQVEEVRTRSLEIYNEDKAKQLAKFNLLKAENLADIRRRGKAAAAERDRLQGEIDALEKEKEIITTSMPDTAARFQILTDQRGMLKDSADNYSLIGSAYDELVIQRNAILSQIEAEKEGTMADTDCLKAEIRSYETEIVTLKEQADRFTRRETAEKRIEELKAEEKKIAAEAEKMASILYLIDLFTRAKVNMLNDKMTGQFEFVKWKLAEIQVNGAVNDQMCELMVSGVGYNSGLNSAARIQAGMDIIKTLQRHYQISAPVWIDNRESCTLIPEMKCQVISLYVSPEDKTLRIETTSKREAVMA